MKTNSSLFLLLIASSAFFFSNCSSDKSGHSNDAHEHNGHEAGHTSGSSAAEATAPQLEVDKKFQQQLANVFDAYIDLKEAFVSSDAKKVKSEASKTKEELAKVDMKLLSGVAHNDWMTYLPPMQGALAEIESHDDIEAQRKSFRVLSDQLYKSIKAFGLGGEGIAYYEYCPMAFDNEGGYWLSDEEKIRNPYFGNKMLGCGEVKEKLK